MGSYTSFCPGNTQTYQEQQLKTQFCLAAGTPSGPSPPKPPVAAAPSNSGSTGSAGSTTGSRTLVTPTPISLTSAGNAYNAAAGIVAGAAVVVALMAL